MNLIDEIKTSPDLTDALERARVLIDCRTRVTVAEWEAFFISEGINESGALLISRAFQTHLRQTIDFDPAYGFGEAYYSDIELFKELLNELTGE